MNTPFFDVIAGSLDTPSKLGRAWLSQKDGRWNMSIDIQSMPLPSQEVHLVSSEAQDLSKVCPAFSLTVPVEREGKKTYWHRVGEIEQVSTKDDRAFRVVFSSIPMSSKLMAFAKDN